MRSQRKGDYSRPCGTQDRTSKLCTGHPAHPFAATQVSLPHLTVSYYNIFSGLGTTPGSFDEGPSTPMGHDN